MERTSVAIGTLFPSPSKGDTSRCPVGSRLPVTGSVLIGHHAEWVPRSAPRAPLILTSWSSAKRMLLCSLRDVPPADPRGFHRSDEGREAWPVRAVQPRSHQK